MGISVEYLTPLRLDSIMKIRGQNGQNTKLIIVQNIYSVSKNMAFIIIHTKCVLEKKEKYPL